MNESHKRFGKFLFQIDQQQTSFRGTISSASATHGDPILTPENSIRHPIFITIATEHQHSCGDRHREKNIRQSTVTMQRRSSRAAHL